MIYALFLAANMLLLLIAAALAHEMGHYFYLKHVTKRHIKIHKKPGKILAWQVGEISDYEQLTDEQYLAVNSYGVIAGGVVIFLLGVIFNSIALVSTILPYLAACIGDIKEMYRMSKKLGLFEDETTDTIDDHSSL